MAASEDCSERCGCSCDTWGHELDTCTGEADTYSLFGSRVLGTVVVSLCTPCRDAISSQRRPYV